MTTLRILTDENRREILDLTAILEFSHLPFCEENAEEEDITLPWTGDELWGITELFRQGNTRILRDYKTVGEQSALMEWWHELSPEKRGVILETELNFLKPDYRNWYYALLTDKLEMTNTEMNELLEHIPDKLREILNCIHTKKWMELFEKQKSVRLLSVLHFDAMERNRLGTLYELFVSVVCLMWKRGVDYLIEHTPNWMAEHLMEIHMDRRWFEENFTNNGEPFHLYQFGVHNTSGRYKTLWSLALFCCVGYHYTPEMFDYIYDKREFSARNFVEQNAFLVTLLSQAVRKYKIQFINHINHLPRRHGRKEVFADKQIRTGGIWGWTSLNSRWDVLSLKKCVKDGFMNSILITDPNANLSGEYQKSVLSHNRSLLCNDIFWMDYEKELRNTTFQQVLHIRRIDWTKGQLSKTRLWWLKMIYNNLAIIRQYRERVGGSGDTGTSVLLNFIETIFTNVLSIKDSEKIVVELVESKLIRTQPTRITHIAKMTCDLRVVEQLQFKPRNSIYHSLRVANILMKQYSNKIDFRQLKELCDRSLEQIRDTKSELYRQYTRLIKIYKLDEHDGTGNKGQGDEAQGGALNSPDESESGTESDSESGSECGSESDTDSDSESDSDPGSFADV